MPLGVFALNSEMEVVFWNLMLEMWTGIPRHEITGRSILFFYPHLKQPKYLQRIKDVFSGSPSAVFSSLLHKYIIPVKLDDSSFRTQQANVSSITGRDGKTYALFSVQDVTELSNRIADYKKMRDQALHEVEERKKAEEKLKLAATVFENTAEAIMILGRSGEIDSVNHAFSVITGYEPMDALGREFRELLISDRHDSTFMAEFWSILIETGRWKGEIWARHKNGRVFPIEVSLNVIIGESGQISHFAAIFDDITQRKRTEELLTSMSYNDDLTGVANRRHFNERLNEEWSRAGRKHYDVSLILLDIDYFKLYNDTYGHQAGDECLKMVAHTLSGLVKRAGELLARYGGEEFAIIAPDSDQDSTLALSEKLRYAIESLDIAHKRSPYGKVTISLGFATLAANTGFTESDLIRLADEALYRAKGGGRNRVEQ